MRGCWSGAGSVAIHVGVVLAGIGAGVGWRTPAVVEVGDRRGCALAIHEPASVDVPDFESVAREPAFFAVPEAPAPEFRAERLPDVDVDGSEAPPERPAPPTPAWNHPIRTRLRINDASNGDVGSDAEAVEVVNPRPEYPALARKRGIEGETVVLVHIAATGEVTTAEVTSPSGSEMLDAAALAAARRWSFRPAKKGGRPVASSQRVRFVFSLR